MREQLVQLAAGGQLAAGVDPPGVRGWLELTAPDGTPTTVALYEHEVLAAVEALAMLYAELHGARPASAARAASRTLRNGTRAARERAGRTRSDRG